MLIEPNEDLKYEGKGYWNLLTPTDTYIYETKEECYEKAKELEGRMNREQDDFSRCLNPYALTPEQCV